MREARARLDRIRWLEPTGWMAALAGTAILLAGFLVFHERRNERQVDGTVQSADWRLNDETGHVYPFIEVELDSGASVRVGNAAPVLPAVGDRITLRERALLFDYVTRYEWDGPEEAPRATLTQAAAP